MNGWRKNVNFNKKTSEHLGASVVEAMIVLCGVGLVIVLMAYNGLGRFTANNDRALRNAKEYWSFKEGEGDRIYCSEDDSDGDQYVTCTLIRADQTQDVCECKAWGFGGEGCHPQALKVRY